MTVYATLEDVRARVDPTYAEYPLLTDDPTLTKAIVKASELVDEHTLGRAIVAWDLEETASDTPYRDALSRAVADQVEFWAEVGAEHDVAGLRGSLVAGRVQAHPVAPTLSPRAKRTLMNAGLYWAGANIG